jgi:L-threonylcarbamoyladenylate synthase
MQIITSIEVAVQVLQSGGVLLYPTETSYALGCDATNDAAVARIFAIKGRPEGKGTPLILPPSARADEFIYMSQFAYILADKYWPGPLNIIGNRAEDSSVSTRCETDGTQSVRKSAHVIASTLAELLGKPIVATSANRSGETAIYTLQSALHEFSSGEAPEAIFDAGDLPMVPASTTVRVIDDTVEVVRQGSIHIR